MGACAAAALLFSAPPALAADEADYPEPDASPVVVTLEGEHGAALAVELYNPKAKVGLDQPIARCTTPCFARVPRGRYRLFVHETGSTLSGGRVFELREPTAIVVSPDDDSQRSTGLALGIGGTVALVGGVVLALASICGGEGCRSDHENFALFGVGLILGGLVAIPVGWTMFGKSFKPDLTLTPLPATGTSVSWSRPGGALLGVRFAL